MTGGDKIKVSLKNCYGIGELDEELDFRRKGHAIYAPNGVMKTSFAKTMIALSKGEKPEDLVYGDLRPASWSILWNDVEIKDHEIFVVKPYDRKYSAGGVSTLLANEHLKNEYEIVHKDIGEAKKSLDKRLLTSAGYTEKSRENIDLIIERIFGEQYYEALLNMKAEIESTKKEHFSVAKYKIIFAPKVKEFLKKDSSKANIVDCADKYNELTEKSPILRKEFQYHNINEVQQQLESNNFFVAEHSINLKDKNSGNAEEVLTDSDFQKKIEAEQLRILDDPELKEKMDSFDGDMKNEDLRRFRQHITESPQVLVELRDLDFDLEAFERNLWLQYIYAAKAEYEALILKYEVGQAELQRVIAEAQKDENDWDAVIEDFKSRFFDLPFEVSIGNKPDVILKGMAPSIIFNFRDRDKKDNKIYSEAQREELLDVLSSGEARALYILNIMFEIRMRWNVRKKTLFVFDDIADSFDYKNKFAIIDYLHYVIKSEDTNFLAIILTHNFDFFRTIENRGICPADQCSMALRDNGKITLAPFKKQSDITNPFNKWKKRLSEKEIQIAYIPFLRNMIEYMEDKTCEDYIKLTSMLHYKDDTDGITIKIYKEIFEKHFTNLKFPEVDIGEKVLGYIIETADSCVEKAQDDKINLENKILLSIAARLLAEKFMIEEIRKIKPKYDVSKRKTGEIFQNFKDEFDNVSKHIKLLRRVTIITPANIHLNAFMYEPILDMGFLELKNLYKEVKEKLEG